MLLSMGSRYGCWKGSGGSAREEEKEEAEEEEKEDEARFGLGPSWLCFAVAAVVAVVAVNGRK